MAGRNKTIMYVRMLGRNEIGKVVDTVREAGDVRLYDILIEETGEVCSYDRDRVIRCDESGAPL